MDGQRHRLQKKGGKLLMSFFPVARVLLLSVFHALKVNETSGIPDPFTLSPSVMISVGD